MTRTATLRTSGFTIIEMLVVLGVLAVLAGVSVVSVTGFRTAAAGIPDDLEAVATELLCDAGRGDVLAADGCAPPAPPDGLPEPLPRPATIELSPGDGTLSATGGTRTVTVTVTDNFGEPFEGGTVRWEVDGPDGASDGQAGPTAASGTATFGYVQAGSGFATVTACIAPDGTAPDDCADEQVEVVDAVTHEWRVQPTFQMWDNTGSATFFVEFVGEVSQAAVDAQGFRLFFSAANCGNTDTYGDALSITVTGASTAGGITTVTFSSNGINLNPAGRHLTVLAGAVTSVDGLTNPAATCVPPATTADPPQVASIQLDPTSGAGDTGDDTATIDLDVDDQYGEPFSAVVRWVVAGANPGTGTVNASGGQGTFSYTGTSDGTDTITFCTRPNGTAPSDCTEGGLVSASATWAWGSDEPPPPPPPPPPPAPEVSSWSRANNNRLTVTWNMGVYATGQGPVVNYQVFGNVDCSGAPSATGTGRHQFNSGNTTFGVNLSSGALQTNQMGNRSMRVLAGTEANVDGVTNAQSPCLTPN